MKRYEMIRELFNNCSGMAIPIVEEIQADDLTAFLKENQYILPGYEWNVTSTEDGAVVYDVVVRGTRSRYTFTEL